MDRSCMAGLMIAAKIASISVRLIDVAVGKLRFSLKFDYYHRTVGEQDYICTPRFQRQFVFKNKAP